MKRIPFHDAAVTEVECDDRGDGQWKGAGRVTGTPLVGQHAYNTSPAHDFAAELDTLADTIRDACLPHQLPPDATQRLVHWHKVAVLTSARSQSAIMLSSLIEQLTERKAVRIEMWGLAFAAGLPFVAGRTMGSVAQSIKCTRSAISKAAVRWTRTLKLEPSRYMKSVNAREAYAERQSQLTQRG